MNPRARITILSLLLTLVLAACVAEPPLPPTPTVAPTATLTPTPTIVWFPPTSTPTAVPTRAASPTPDLAAEAGPLQFSDDFSDDSLWTLASSPSGSAALANNHLTLSATRDRVYLYSLRNRPTLANYYLGITASPNLCRGEDEFGLFIRTTTDLDYYRFGISCDSRAHVDRIYRDTANVMQGWQTFPFLASAAQSGVRLGVWAEGRELRFYANGQYLFTVTDTVLNSGTLGLFIRSANSAGMSVNFSDLVVYDLASP